MRRQIGILAIIAAAVMASGCGKKDEAKATATPPLKVKVVAVAPTSTYGSQSYSGTVEESSGTTVSFSAAGTLQTLNVNAGDRIAKGQLIGTIDDSSLRHAYDIANVTLDEARDVHSRMKQLHDAGSLPDMKWVEAENALRQAQSAEAIAKNALDDARLTAPISGYVSEKFADAGQVVAPGVPVVKIVAINPVKVSISMPENEISKIAVGTEAVITVSALGGEQFAGKVTDKGVAGNPITRSYDVKMTVANPEGRLLPGMICDVVLDNQPDAEAAEAIVLPNSAVLLDSDNRNFVWLADKGVARKQIIDVAGMTDGGLIVSGGLAQGDSVIVAGQQKVGTGSKVIAE